MNKSTNEILQQNNLLATYLLKAPNVEEFEKLGLGLTELRFLEGYSLNTGRLDDERCQLSAIYSYVKDHIQKNGNLPSKTTLISRFPETLQQYEDTVKDIEFDTACEMIRERFCSKGLIYTYKDGMADLKVKPHELLTVMEKIIRNIYALMSRLDEVSTIEISELPEKRFEQWKNMSQTHIMNFPFYWLTKHGFRIREGDLISLHSRQKVGKSWLCTYLATHAGLQKVPTLFVTIEISAEDIRTRSDVIVSRILNEQLDQVEKFDFKYSEIINVDSKIESQYKRYLEHVYANQPSLKIINSASKKNIDLGMIENLIKKDKYKFVVIDGIYLMSGVDLGWDKFHGVITSLKNMAMRNKVAIMITNQSNREGHSAFGDAIERASDLILSLKMGMKGEPTSTRRLHMDGSRTLQTIFVPAVFDFDVDNGLIKEV